MPRPSSCAGGAGAFVMRCGIRPALSRGCFAHRRTACLPDGRTARSACSSRCPEPWARSAPSRRRA